MKIVRKSVILVLILATVILAAGIQQASAQVNPLLTAIEFAKLVGAGQPPLLGTTGACNNEFPGGPCTQNSTLVLLHPQTGKLIRTIGPVGFTVNGLTYDRIARKLYATTAIGCGLPGSVCPFHGLITINAFTGKGTPVNKNVVNFGLPGDDSPIHGPVVDIFGNMVAWYDEFLSGEGCGDTYVRINQKTGVATEFTCTGINTNQNGLGFSQFNVLWNIDSPKRNLDGTVTQDAFILNPFNGKPVFSFPVTPPTTAALGDFFPGTNRYYGLKFQGFDPLGTTFIELVDIDGVNEVATVTPLGQTVNFLHSITFIPIGFMPQN